MSQDLVNEVLHLNKVISKLREELTQQRQHNKHQADLLVLALTHGKVKSCGCSHCEHPTPPPIQDPEYWTEDCRVKKGWYDQEEGGGRE